MSAFVAAMYQGDPRWDNVDLFTASEDDREGAMLSSERLRVYDYCFLQEELDVVDVFDTGYFKAMGFDAWDFQCCRMFPFLNGGSIRSIRLCFLGLYLFRKPLRNR